MAQDGSTRRSRWLRLLAPMLGLALVAAACGGDDEEGGDGDETTATVDLTEALGEPSPASGEPVRIGLISASDADNALAAQFTRAEEGMNAAIEYANEYRGGIAGRPIELVICQGGETPAGSQECANRMVNDEVVAVVMPFTANGSSMVPILTEAGIPYIASSGTSSEELTSPGAFVLTGGFPATLAAFAAHARDNDVEKFSILATDGPAVLQAAETLGGLVFGNAGVEYEVVPTPVGTADMSPQVQAAVDNGATAVGMVGDLTFCSSFLQAYQTLGLDLPRYIIATCIDPTNIEAYPGLIEGSIMTGGSSTDTESEDAEVYAAIATSYGDFDPDPTVSTGQSSGVIPLLSFVNVMDSYEGEVSPAGVLEHIQSATETPLFLGDGATFTCDGTAIPILKNICSAQLFIGEIDGEGTLVDPELVDTGPLFGG